MPSEHRTTPAPAHADEPLGRAGCPRRAGVGAVRTPRPTRWRGSMAPTHAKNDGRLPMNRKAGRRPVSWAQPEAVFGTLCASAMVCLLALFGGTHPVARGASDTVQTSQRPARTNLLIYRGRKGDGLPVKSVRDWRERRAEILRAMQEVMGPLPGKEKSCPLDVKVEEEVDCSDYVRRFLTYASEPGARVPAYLLIPKAALDGKQKTRGILC